MCVTGEPDAVKAARPVRRGADGKVLRAAGVTRRRPTLPLTQKVREAGRIVNVSVVVATAVNSEGRREIVGMDVGTSEDGAFRLAFLRSLSARDLGGVKLVVSDAHQGLRDATATVFGGAGWQRCRTHFMTNLLTRVPRSAQPWVANMVRTIYQQPSPQEVHAQLERVIAQLQDPFPQVASRLDEAGPDVPAFSSFPLAHWKKIWSNNPLERLDKEIRRRTDLVGIFPNRPAVRRLVGTVLAEQHDEWAVGRRYMTQEVTTSNEALPRAELAEAREQSRIWVLNGVPEIEVTMAEVAGLIGSEGAPYVASVGSVQERGTNC